MYTKAELYSYACVDPKQLGYSWYLKVTPKAHENTIQGVLALYGHHYLKVKVTAAPVAGKANMAVLELFSKVLEVPLNQLQIISGHTAALKILSYVP